MGAESAAAIILGLVTSHMHETLAKSNTKDPRLLELFAPFVEALGQAFTGFRGSWPAGLPPRPAPLNLENGYHFYERLIVRDHRPPLTAFHTVLFERIAAHPVVAATISWLCAPGPPHPDTNRQVNDLMGAVFTCLIPYIDEALDLYLNHHCHVTSGFEAVARAQKLVPQEDREVRGVRQQTAQRLVIWLLGQVLAETSAPAAERTLEAWALGGWVTPEGKLKNVVFQALLGPGMDGAREARRRGAIIQGLMHQYFSEECKIPFTHDVSVGYVQCPHNAAPVMLPLPLRPAAPTCPVCGEPVCFDSHRIVARRQNIVGEILEYEDGESRQASCPQERKGQFVWRSWRLYKCPPDHWSHTLAGQAVVGRDTLLHESHYFPDFDGKCPLFSSLLSALPDKDPVRVIHAGGRSQRPITLFFPVHAGVQEAGSNEAEAGSDISHVLIPYLQSLYALHQRHPRAKAALATLGLTAGTLQSDEALLAVSRNVFALLQLWGKAHRDSEQFAQKAASELRSMWESRTQEPGGPLPWGNVHEWVEAIGDLLDMLAELCASGVEEPRHVRKGAQLWKM